MAWYTDNISVILHMQANIQADTLISILCPWLPKTN